MTKRKNESNNESNEKKKCGIIMPMSKCDGQESEHWEDVRDIITQVAEGKGFETRIVSSTSKTNLIQKEILQNIYHDDLVICDVSGHNPNVFLELGIRMATLKPTIILKDKDTLYPFDTSPNRYISYPRSLRHPDMEEFKTELSSSITSTIKQKPEDSFIGILGHFQTPKKESIEIPAVDIILQEINKNKNNRSKKIIIEINNNDNSAEISFSGYIDSEILDVYQNSINWADWKMHHVTGRGNNMIVHLSAPDSKLLISDLCKRFISKFD